MTCREPMLVLPRAQRVAVAYSGGRDSTALLHATRAAAAPLGLQVFGFHVHHGLSRHADAWLAACREQCERWSRRGWPVTFACQRLTRQPQPGESVEAWAREHRYDALLSLAREHGVELILLAQHRRDQAETFLLQALRGAGMSGLAGMPRTAQRNGITWARPWLDESRESIDAYVRKHRLRSSEDDSNADSRYARNRLRLQVWPALLAAFPQAEASIAQGASWAQQARACLEELAGLDLEAVSSSRGFELRAWQALSEARRSNVLRAWLKQHLGRAATASLARRLLIELQFAGSASWPCPGGSLRLYRGVLAYRPGPFAAPEASREAQLSVRRAGVYRLPGWAGELHVQRTRQGGVPLAWLGQLELRARCGGEQFQAGVGRPPRSLKKQYQAAALATWLRDGPLLYSGGHLVFVPGIGLDARMLALPGQAQVTLEWQRMSAKAGAAGGRPA
jgi:tRNA(Ile)-lysidine synthase